MSFLRNVFAMGLRFSGLILFLALVCMPAEAHPGHDHSISTGVWPAHRATDVTAGRSNEKEGVTAEAIVAAVSTPAAAAASTPSATGLPTDNRLTSWKLASGVTGQSTDSAINVVVSQALADVNTVAYDDDYVYIRTSGIPSHAVGTFGPNPSVPGDLDATYRVARNPTEQLGTKTGSVNQLGAIGVMVNGAAFYSPSDGTYWRPATGTLTNPGDPAPPNAAWSTNALWRRAGGMDAAGGHPSPLGNQMNFDGSAKGFYHYHRLPTGLINQIDPDNEGTAGSPVVGYAFDGFAIVGPYAYETQGDGSLAAVQMTSSYAVGDASIRGANGPSVATYELGSFIEDFVYVDGSGRLNEYNMAFVKLDQEGRAVLVDETDADGEWAYFLTLDAIAGSTNDTTLDGEVAWPYVVGPQFFGVIDTESIGGGQITLEVPNDVDFFFDQLTGDFNGDGVVDAADYTVWRQSLGSDYGALLNDPTGVAIGDAQFALLRSNYGNTWESNSPAQSLSVAEVPEPASCYLLGLGVVPLGMNWRRRKRSRTHSTIGSTTLPVAVSEGHR